MVEERGRQMDEPPPALNRFYQVEDKGRAEGSELSGHTLQVQRKGKRGSVVSQVAQGHGYSIPLDQDIELVLSSVLGNLAVENDYSHGDTSPTPLHIRTLTAS